MKLSRMKDYSENVQPRFEKDIQINEIKMEMEAKYEYNRSNKM